MMMTLVAEAFVEAEFGRMDPKSIPQLWPADRIAALESRVQELEAALMPFAQQGVAMISAQMNMRAAGNDEGTPGGTWCCTGEGDRWFADTFENFEAARDVLGHERVRLAMASDIDAADRLKEVMREAETETIQ